ncbi:MAG TPA: ElyC/SanA/YdcF family protein [Spirochaetota bacterium]|nr:ElyC/SanA/YdcF family protein [Spirochaetota bacterium]HPS87429.1 ElyC/SanA/YdcF family protein [Spirochaetota bacterium]
MKGKHRIIYILVSVLVLFSISVIMVDGYISSYSAPYIYEEWSKLPENKCGLLPGTSKYKIKGGINPYFSERLDAAAMLYHTGKIKYIIASGDNSELNYNEPRTMMAGLRDRGVPAENIFLDYAGFRTLDSIVRAKEIFGQDSITIISQRFHNERAVYIGRVYGISVTGFDADDNEDPSGILVRIREVFARFKAFLDVRIFMEQPKFLGEKIIIP